MPSDGTKKSKEIDQHHAMVLKFREILNAVNLASVLGKRSKGWGIIELKADTIDDCLNVLLGASVGRNGELPNW